ncbi:MAG: crossover junction endodeoxyribonuclease RuvC [Acidimicrobiales bacterium]
MFVLGIDPGLSRCGFGGVAEEHGEQLPVAAGVITSDPALAVPDRLAALHRELEALVGELDPDVVAVERVFFQTNARTAMAVGQASGVALLVAAEHGCRVVEYTSNEVKLAVAGYGSADKTQVQQMVARLLRLARVPEPPDVADALALALCHLAACRYEDLVRSAPGEGSPGPREARR